MGATIAIRPAGRSDLAEVLDLYRLLAGPYLSAKPVSAEDAWQMLAGDSRQHLLVADVSNRVVGTATLIVVPNIGHGGQPWGAVENVVVSEAFRSRGVGAALMAALGETAQEKGCYKLVLSSNLARPEAHVFYRRLGWQQTHVGFSLELK